MLQLVVKNEWLAQKLFRSALCDRFVRYDLRALSSFSDEELIGYIYRRVGIHGGITKQTAQNRFSDLDQKTAGLIAQQTDASVHDVGVSSGITSVELYTQLKAANVAPLQFSVSDRYAKFYTQTHGSQTDVFDADQRLQCSYLGPLYGDRHTSSKYPLSVWLHKRASAFDSDQAESFYLFHPKLLSLIEDKHINVLEYDVLTTRPETAYSYVRCMNLLNLSYFDKPQLLQGIANVRASLRSDGILQVGRTEQSGENHVGFYRNTASGLERIDQIGDGSEIHDLIEANNRPPHSLAS
ncbi:MAG: hypothetical protein AB8B93_08515 [Pseudomonadales bacterium]